MSLPDKMRTDVTGEDFYAFFNIRRDATAEEITRAYRQLSMFYHPDRHVDPEKKNQAQQLFSKIRYIYEVLSDPQKRTIYDTVGPEGLNTAGWELVERTTNPKEIREEYERLCRLREEEMLYQKTNPTGTVSLELSVADVFRRNVDSLNFYGREFPYVELRSMNISQSVEGPLSVRDRLVFAGTMQTRNGVGNGGISLGWRRIVDPKTWAEVELGLSEGLVCSLKINRSLSSIMYGSAQLIASYDTNVFNSGVVVAVSRQLAKRWQGVISLKLGIQNSITTSLTYDSASKRKCVIAGVVGVPAWFAMFSYTHVFGGSNSRLRTNFRLGNIGAITDVSYEWPISKYSRLQSSCRVHYPAGLSLKFKLQRASQSYAVRVVLTEHEFPVDAVFCSLLIPVLCYGFVRWIANRWFKARTEEGLAEDEQAIRTEKRKQAEAAILLMSDVAQRCREREESINGLVIIEALYGRLVSFSHASNVSEDVVDVTIPLQAMVKDSKLVLQSVPKSQINGFYDPCTEGEKLLKVVYKFQDHLHQHIYRDAEPVSIPLRSHQMKEQHQ